MVRLTDEGCRLRSSAHFRCYPATAPKMKSFTKVGVMFSLRFFQTTSHHQLGDSPAIHHLGLNLLAPVMKIIPKANHRLDGAKTLADNEIMG